MHKCSESTFRSGNWRPSGRGNEVDAVVPDKGAEDAFVVHDEDDEHDDDEMFQHEDEDDEEEFLLEDTGNGEGFMAVKPWIGAMVAPSEYEDAFIPTEKPSEELKLDWVFGYTKEGRNNAFELPSGEIMWPSGTVGGGVQSIQPYTALSSGPHRHYLCCCAEPYQQEHHCHRWETA